MCLVHGLSGFDSEQGGGIVKPGQPVSHNDAEVLLRAVQRKLGRTLTMRDVPKAVRTSARALDVEKAMRMIEAEMLASLKRCEDLEREL